MAANDIQIGGSHYKSGGLEVWDYIELNDIGYLEGCAIKYVTRWRDKGGIEDLRKIIHYTDKILEMLGDGRIRRNPDQPPMRVHADYCRDNNVTDGVEMSIIWLLSTWENEEHLYTIKKLTTSLIENNL